MILIDRWKPATLPPPAPDPRELHLWLIDLAHPADHLSGLLSRDERQRCERILDDAGKRRFIAMRGALRQILGNYLGIDAMDIHFRYGPYGKPEIDHATPLAFNLSHSADLALLAVTQGTAIGIDLEPDRVRPNARAIARRIFPEKTLSAIGTLDDEAFHQAFLRHWTALEARVKLEGGSLFRPPSNSSQVVNFRPRRDWVAAVAMAADLPPCEQWLAFRPASCRGINCRSGLARE